MRAIYYYGFSEADSQQQIPVIHPVVDHTYVFGQPVFGGELSYRANLTSLSRGNADFNPIIVRRLQQRPLRIQHRRPRCFDHPATVCFAAFPASTPASPRETQWKRSITDSYGQIFTPFVKLRGDAAAISIDNAPGVANYFTTGDSTEFRAMPTVGLEYRYPFISVHAWGTQTLEPIGQVIVRPDETRSASCRTKTPRA